MTNLKLAPNASEIFGAMIAAGVPHYKRERNLPYVTSGFWKHELEDFSVEGCGYIVSQLEQKLRAMHRLALTGHWSYDVNRHTALHIAHDAELKALERAECNARLLAAE